MDVSERACPTTNLHKPYWLSTSKSYAWCVSNNIDCPFQQSFYTRIFSKYSININLPTNLETESSQSRLQHYRYLYNSFSFQFISFGVGVVCTRWLIWIAHKPNETKLSETKWNEKSCYRYTLVAIIIIDKFHVHRM